MRLNADDSVQLLLEALGVSNRGLSGEKLPSDLGL